MGDHDGEFLTGELDEDGPASPAPSLNLDELDRSDLNLDPAPDTADSGPGWAPTDIVDSAMGNNIAVAVDPGGLGSAAAAISSSYESLSDEISAHESTMAKVAGLGLADTSSSLLDSYNSALAGLGSAMGNIAGLIDTGLSASALTGLSAAQSILADTDVFQSASALAGLGSAMGNIAGLIDTGLSASALTGLSAAQSILADTDVFQSASALAGLGSAMGNIAGLIDTGLSASDAATSNFKSVFDRISTYESTFDRNSQYESTMAKFADLGLGGLSGSLLGADRLAWAGNFVVEPGTSSIEVASPARIVLPHEATEAEARDFLRLLHLALLTAQSRGRAGCQDLLRLARSTSSKAASLTLAVSTVYLLMQLVPDFDGVVGDLANAIEVVLFPSAAWMLIKSNNK